MRPIPAIGLALLFAFIAYACATSNADDAPAGASGAWSSAIPKVEVTCGDGSCL